MEACAFGMFQRVDGKALVVIPSLPLSALAVRSLIFIYWTSEGHFKTVLETLNKVRRSSQSWHGVNFTWRFLFSDRTSSTDVTDIEMSPVAEESY
ncbi:hypothetical protein CPAR01_15669 [Colletotrichum paranaense]|uniref:Uncharacterized protein n=1 Tax=Colletotrichum paranaense TaxID=1914294 RepID=A0ABQ9RYK4_9PEZI|nr:uncharacterized protein CPAR01_15669 [Colletotrichum paranaense]KAK1519231.1 hypothetical protein CPAR01_15669 [Colletotrichum paranaense]